MEIELFPCACDCWPFGRLKTHPSSLVLFTIYDVAVGDEEHSSCSSYYLTVTLLCAIQLSMAHFSSSSFVRYRLDYLQSDAPPPPPGRYAMFAKGRRGGGRESKLHSLI